MLVSFPPDILLEYKSVVLLLQFVGSWFRKDFLHKKQN